MARTSSRWGSLLRLAALTIAVLGNLGASSEENAPGTTGILGAEVGGKRTLVLADGSRIQDSHSLFFSALEVRSRPAPLRVVRLILFFSPSHLRRSGIAAVPICTGMLEVSPRYFTSKLSYPAFARTSADCERLDHALQKSFSLYIPVVHSAT